MRIGEFAKSCGTQVSLLRHYDKQGVLCPEFVDEFTGYRYYSAGQIDRFRKIAALKQAGFSLAQIKWLLANAQDGPLIGERIEEKRRELTEQLAGLDVAKLMLMGETGMQKPTIVEVDGAVEMRLTLANPVKDFAAACQWLDNAARAQGYQRVSTFKPIGVPGASTVEIRIDVVKLGPAIKRLDDDIQSVFEDDDVVGKWAVMGEYAVREDFFAGIAPLDGLYCGAVKQIYFLPGGERYWVYGWTKGFLIYDSGDGTALNDYVVEEHDGERYMFVQHKGGDYRCGGRPTVLVLRQADSVAYMSVDIAKVDKIDLDFVADAKVLGKWTAVCYLAAKEDFSPGQRDDANWLYFKAIEFFPAGQCTSVYGKEVVAGMDMQTWTKGYVLRKWNRTACAYEIREVDGVEYLIMEWKSGDYRWGGFETDYYVFVRG